MLAIAASMFYIKRSSQALNIEQVKETPMKPLRQRNAIYIQRHYVKKPYI